MRSIYVVVIIFLITGCSGVAITDAGNQVRAIQPDWKNKCEFITASEISSAAGATPAACAKSAQNVMRNTVAALGGNAYVKTYEINDYCATGGTTINFEVYKCEFFHEQRQGTQQGSQTLSTAIPESNNSLREKLKELNDLYESGLVSEDVYLEQQRKILDANQLK